MVTIVIISYNTRRQTVECLRSLDARSLAGDIVIVDNCSEDESCEAIAEEVPAAFLIRSKRNLGFAAANNLAAKNAVGDYLLLLNPDTVVQDRAIDKLLAFAREHPDAGIWGGRTTFADGSLNPASCWGRMSVWSVFCQGVGLSSLFRNSSFFNPEGYGGWKRDTVREVDIVSGCFFLIRRELWEKLGGFDPAFFMYGEEADLCLRARKIGARPMVTPDATIIHHGGASEQVREDKMVRLLTAKVMLMERHWRPRLVPLGVLMLKAWPLSRAVAWGLLSFGFRRRAIERAREWWAVWVRRGEWTASG